MPEAGVLEISALAKRHPELALVEECASKLIIRLSVDPTDLGPEVRHREVRIEHRSRQVPEIPQDVVRVVAWTGLDRHARDRFRRHRLTVGDDTITEWAAIGMMGLLIHELEGGVIKSVVRKGTGGDYEVTLGPNDPVAHVEVRGIREDRTASGGVTAAKVEEKRDQLLGYEAAGFVSVTTFAYATAAEVRPILHYVRRLETRRRRRRNTRGRK